MGCEEPIFEELGKAVELVLHRSFVFLLHADVLSLLVSHLYLLCDDFFFLLDFLFNTLLFEETFILHRILLLLLELRDHGLIIELLCESQCAVVVELRDFLLNGVDGGFVNDILLLI